MATLTLVPETLAKPGSRFTFLGPNPGGECAGCPLQKLCFGLEPGRTYAVEGLREVRHPCALHDGGRVRVVTVVPASFPTTVEASTLRGTAATWTPIPCGRPQCPSWGLCHPTGPAPSARYEITERGAAVPCPAGYDLVRVELRKMGGPPSAAGVP